MASTTQETLYSNFQALVSDNGLSSVLDSSRMLASALQNTATQIQSAGGGGVGNAVLSTVSKVFTSGLGLVPLIGGLFGLFGGGGAPEPPPLVKYTLPERLYFQGADVGGGIASADYDQMGTPRAYVTPLPSLGSDRASSAAPQITVNVQAMDSRSFLDHSTEIAQAVRQAMLNLNPVNDVVSDL
jgi:hypothetical protein